MSPYSLMVVLAVGMFVVVGVKRRCCCWRSLFCGRACTDKYLEKNYRKLVFLEISDNKRVSFTYRLYERRFLMIDIIATSPVGLKMFKGNLNT